MNAEKLKLLLRDLLNAGWDEHAKTIEEICLATNNGIKSPHEENGRLLKAIHAAWEATEDIQRLYNDASDSECRCGIDPEGHCPHCSKWEKADAQVDAARSLLEEQISKDYES